MTIDKNSGSSFPSASEYILDNFEPIDRIAMLVLNRDLGEILQRITSALKASSPEFQASLRHKNVTGSDIYIGMNPLRKRALNRTKKDIRSIRHVYLDLDHGGQEALNSVENSRAVPKPNYVLTSSPGKFQTVWKVEGMGLREAEIPLPERCRFHRQTGQVHVLPWSHNLVNSPPRRHHNLQRDRLHLRSSLRNHRQHSRNLLIGQIDCESDFIGRLR
jgi:hypothetical protein